MVVNDEQFEAIADVFEQLELAHPDSSDTPWIAFLDTDTGQVTHPQTEAALNLCQDSPTHIPFPKFEETTLDRYERILNFIDTLEDGAQRIALDRLVRGRGAMRRFKEYLHKPEGEPLRPLWEAAERHHREDLVRDWLSGLG